jgi:arginine:pyruvate transaminase
MSGNRKEGKSSATPPFSALTHALGGRRSRAWDVTDRAAAMDREGRDIIHLGVGDPDFDTPQVIVDAAISSLRSGRTHYSPLSGEPNLRATIAKTGSAKYGVDISAEQVIVFPGAQCALYAAMTCLSGASDEVIILEPFYASYEGVAHAGGACVVSVPLSADNGFDLDIELIASAITKNTRVILANSPGNPTGAVFSRSSWEALIELCRNKGIWLISDEVYSEFAFDRGHDSPLSLPNAGNNVVLVDSVSKTYAMTGWRLGWTIAPLELASHLNNLAQCLLFGVSQFTQDAAELALREAHRDVRAMKEAFHSRRDVLCDALESIDGLVVHRPAGGMFVLVDVSTLGFDGDEFANALLDQSGVAVVPGSAFGDSVQDFVRIGYVVGEPRLQEAAARIADFVAQHSSPPPFS